jgi:transposase
MAKAHANSWEVTDAFWKRVEPLIPQPVRDPDKQYKRAVGAGRPTKPLRLVFEAIMYVLRTGCQWKALPTAACRHLASRRRQPLNSLDRKIPPIGVSEKT